MGRNVTKGNLALYAGQVASFLVTLSRWELDDREEKVFSMVV
jgi:hypothetical protein